MTAWDAIRARRAIRRFADRPIEPDAVDRILRAGRRAGSSKNSQRWDVIVIRDRARLVELGTVGPWAGHLAGAAMAVALVTPDPRADGQPLSVMFDLGQVAENMMLAAWELGIGSVPATVYEQEIDSPRPRLPRGPLVRVHPVVRLSGGRDPAHRAAQTRRPPAPRVDRPRGALVGRRYCHWKRRLAKPKQTTVQPTRTATQIDNGAYAAPPTMTWRSAAER